MKRKVLALVIPALLAAGAAHAAEVYNKDGNKLDLYGKVDGLHYFSDNSGSDGDQTYVRFGFKGETQINDQLTGYGQWEYNVQANTTEGEGANSRTRLAFAGLKFGDYGSFDYGRNYGVLYDVEGWTDMLPEFGGDSYTYADNYMTGRANGVATYRNTDFFGLVDGLSFALQYRAIMKIAVTVMKVQITVLMMTISVEKTEMVLVFLPLTILVWALAQVLPTQHLTVQTIRFRMANSMQKAIKQMHGLLA